MDKFNMQDDRNRMLDEIMAMLLIVEPVGQQRRIGPRPARGKTYYPNGAREIARRLRQAARLAERA